MSMKIFACKQIADIDKYTIEHEPIESIDLMERASMKLYEWVVDHYDESKLVKIFVGPGNNGGDGLALARLLRNQDYQIQVYLIKIGNRLSPDAQVNLERLQNISSDTIIEVDSVSDLPELHEDDLLIDALFGSGLTRPLKGLAYDVVQTMNHSEATIVAIDIPSGLMGENNSQNDLHGIIKADFTLSFQFPKLAFLFPENQKYVGEWFVLLIGLHQEKIDREQTPYRKLSMSFVKSLLIRRNKFDHKGTFGHGLLISGSYGKMGASILASKACLRSGIGLLSSHIPRLGYEIMQTAVPEAMVSIDRSDLMFTEYPDLAQFKAIGIGPGIDKKQNTYRALRSLLQECKVPCVLDADAINLIGENPELKEELPIGTVFTPHMKEFERLIGKTSDPYTRNQKQIEFAKQYQAVVVLKGAYSAIACPDGTCYFNSTGNPGMATAGSGDVLTGIILSLLAQGYSSHIAAIIAVYVHGLAGDLAAEDLGWQALTAGDIINYLPQAWKKLD